MVPAIKNKNLVPALSQPVQSTLPRPNNEITLLFRIKFAPPTPASSLAQHGAQDEGIAETPDFPVSVSVIMPVPWEISSSVVAIPLASVA